MNIKKTLIGIVGASVLFLAGANDLHAQERKGAPVTEYNSSGQPVSQYQNKGDRGDDTLAPMALGIYLLLKKYHGKDE